LLQEIGIGTVGCFSLSERRVSIACLPAHPDGQNILLSSSSHQLTMPNEPGIDPANAADLSNGEEMPPNSGV
jgi:hypothetical protein